MEMIAVMSGWASGVEFIILIHATSLVLSANISLNKFRKFQMNVYRTSLQYVHILLFYICVKLQTSHCRAGSD